MNSESYRPMSSSTTVGEVLPAIRDEVYVPSVSVQALVDLLEKVEEAKERVLNEGINADYAVIPGTGSKPSLLKPGAEKLCQLFGYRIRAMDQISETETPYGVGYKCVLHDSQGRVVGVCDGWADKTESKARSWSKNTVMKMAQKRAFVGATLWACNASAIFTQDVEDEIELGDAVGKPIDVTRKIPQEKAGAEAFERMAKWAQEMLGKSEDEASEFVVTLCRNSGFSSTDDLADAGNANLVWTDLRAELDLGGETLLSAPGRAQEAALEHGLGEDGDQEAAASGSLVLRRLIKEYHDKLPENHIWECIKIRAKIKTIDELAEEGAYEMCVTFLDEMVEDEKTKPTIDVPLPGDSARQATSKPRSRTTKSTTKNK